MELKGYPTIITNSSSIESKIGKPGNDFTSGCSWQEDLKGDVILVFNPFGVNGKCLRKNMGRTLCLNHSK